MVCEKATDQVLFRYWHFFVFFVPY